MSKLLPTRTDATVQRSGDPAVLCIDDEETQAVFSALSSETAYEVFQLLNEEPATPTAIAGRLELSIQNVQYHLENLQDAGLIEVADTCYSEKGREMDVFVVSTEPTLVFLGTDDDRASLRRAFKAFSSLVGPPAILLAIGETLSRLLAGE
ncbi:ArsR/SmtB family transcription factor [Natronobacterium texcoconense]|uniref:Helix-turn-helix domain-containing protein n=1 Tax=Natronobacterium texcoconense TaxID=1095778 RepID=A0A1H1FLL4_NATTX|nr:helix-turn-helix domain-containing protein [Natronobacterium texcoconense]SDR01787.1 Helix-turn-helix domain-containing protein [Natronobacterium texcoconense]